MKINNKIDNEKKKKNSFKLFDSSKLYKTEILSKPKIMIDN